MNSSARERGERESIRGAFGGSEEEEPRIFRECGMPGGWDLLRFPLIFF